MKIKINIAEQALDLFDDAGALVKRYAELVSLEQAGIGQAPARPEPAPREPELMLEANYGPGWRVRATFRYGSDAFAINTEEQGSLLFLPRLTIEVT